MADAVIECVYRAIDVVNELLPLSDQLLKSPSTILVGPDGSLDSMGLINLLLEIESQLRSIGEDISVVDLITSSAEIQDGNLNLKRLNEILESVLRR